MLKKSIALLLTLYFLFACTEKKMADNGLSPLETLKSIQLPPGFTIELLASEPMISDPVAMEVDENGDIYIVQMPGYPEDTAGTGTIKLLTDTNGDGLPDKSVVFADHLKLPTGIMKWKKGILVIDVPNIIYMEDTNQDGKADIRKVMITGMALTNPQHIANTPIYGTDNWIYVAHMGSITPKISMLFNDTGTNVRFPENTAAPQLPRNADGRNIRFKPESYELEMLAGESQYGHTFDTWGHHFCVENADHIFHEVMAARYLRRNPDLLVADASDYIPDHGDACEVYPITTNPENQLLTDRGVITSACGITWYQGGLFPDSFNNITLVAEPTSNIIHADRINEKGASFTASRVYEKKEFFASTDAWCRPVQCYIGPDGALYVIDYYRKIIEHPEWLSEEAIHSGDLNKGTDKGRIYRITPKGTPAINWCSQFKTGNSSTQQLVQLLNSNNIWWRRLAQRLLMDRKDPSAVTLLNELIDTASSAAGIVHALWTLDGYNAIDASTLSKALHHPADGVRENAILLTEKYLDKFSLLQNELLALQNDPAAKVRFQLLCTLGSIKNAASETVQQKILMRDIEDKWVHIAALSSSVGKEMALLEKTIPALSSNPSEGKALFFTTCAGVIGLSQRHQDIKKIIRLACTNNVSSSAWWQAACLKGLAKVLSVKSIPQNLEQEKSILLSKFSAATMPELRSSAIELLAILGSPQNKKFTENITKAKTIAAGRQAEIDYRVDALKLIAINKNSADTALTEKIIRDTTESALLQQAAIQTYNFLSSSAASHSIIRNWKKLSRDVRDAGINILLESPGNRNLLLDAVQNGIIQTTSISWPRKVALMNNDDELVRNRSRKLLAPEIESRENVYKNYLPALAINGDAAKGLIVFKNVCSTCHQVGGKNGKFFGPDLGSIRNRDAASIMADILNPNRSIAVTYELWTLTKTNGEKISGIKSGETSSSISLKQLNDLQVTVARNDIKLMEASETSAMPVGLESALSINDMAHLLAYLRNSK